MYQAGELGFQNEPKTNKLRKEAGSSGDGLELCGDEADELKSLLHALSRNEDPLPGEHSRSARWKVGGIHLINFRLLRS